MTGSDLLQHDLYIGSRKPVSRGNRDSAQLGVNGCLTTYSYFVQGASHPLSEAHLLRPSRALILLIVFLIKGGLEAISELLP